MTTEQSILNALTVRDWTKLSTLRAALPNIPRAELDRALIGMSLDETADQIILTPDYDMANVTETDRAAYLDRFGLVMRTW